MIPTFEQYISKTTTPVRNREDYEFFMKSAPVYADQLWREYCSLIKNNYQAEMKKAIE